MKNFRCHDQQQRVVVVLPHRPSTLSARPNEPPTNPNEGMFCPTDQIYNSFTLQNRLPDLQKKEKVVFNLLVSGGCWKRIGLTGHPIAVVKVAIASIVQDDNNNNDNIMQRAFLNMVWGTCKFLISTPGDIRNPFNIETTEFMIMISHVFKRQLGCARRKE